MVNKTIPRVDIIKTEIVSHESRLAELRAELSQETMLYSITEYFKEAILQLNNRRNTMDNSAWGGAEEHDFLKKVATYSGYINYLEKLSDGE